MISNTQKENLENFLDNLKCEVEIPSDQLKPYIFKYDFNLGTEEVFENGVKIKVIHHSISDQKLLLYEGYLLDCFEAFRKEIELNVLNFSIQETKTEYLKKIEVELSGFIEAKKFRITNLKKADANKLTRLNKENLKLYDIQVEGVLEFLETFRSEYSSLFGQTTELKLKNPEGVNLKVNQIALIYIYENIQITRENANKIAASHKWKSKSSGEGLFQDYTKYRGLVNRKGKPSNCTAKIYRNKIELIRSVLDHLTNEAKQRATDEIDLMEAIYKNEYESKL